MELSTEKKDMILAKLGLAAVMHTSQSDPAYFDTKQMYDSSIFKIYNSKEYLNSRLREMDEVYRFCNMILLHIATGLRLEYSVYEDYSGEDEYKLLKLFVITNNLDLLKVEDVDFDTKMVITEKGKISFSELKLDVQGD